jgi:hypothetical protein
MLTTHRYQYHVDFALESDPIYTPICSIFGRPCTRPYEARDSALIHVFIYSDVVRAYTIGDIYYKGFTIFYRLIEFLHQSSLPDQRSPGVMCQYITAGSNFSALFPKKS